MVTVAVVFDLASAIPWVGLIFSGIGYGILGLWFMIKQVNPIGFSKKQRKKLAAFASEWIFGFFGLSIWPGITVWTVITIRAAQNNNNS